MRTIDLTAIVEDERNGLAQVRQTFLARLALTVRARHLSAIRNVPGTVLLDDCGELVAHVQF